MDADAIWRYCLRKHYSAAYADYWMAHERCEACGGLSEAPHHIRTRGAGGDDDANNLLALCFGCHAMIHRGGKTVFCKLHPHLKAKIDAALERSKV